MISALKKQHLLARYAIHGMMWTTLVVAVVVLLGSIVTLYTSVPDDFFGILFMVSAGFLAIATWAWTFVSFLGVFHLSITSGCTRKEFLISSFGASLFRNLLLSLAWLLYYGFLYLVFRLLGKTITLPSMDMGNILFALLLLLGGLLAISILGLIFSASTLRFGILPTIIGFYALYFSPFFLSMAVSVGKEIQVPVTILEKILHGLAVFSQSVSPFMVGAIAVIVVCGILIASIWSILRTSVR